MPSRSRASTRALERAAAYREAGADVLFVEAPTRDELARDRRATRRTRLPLMANMVEGGKTPILPRRRTGGARLLAGDLPGRHCPRARATRRSEFYASLARARHTEPFRDRMFDFDGSTTDRHAGDARARPALRDAAAPAARTGRAVIRSIPSRSPCSTAAWSRSPTRWTRRSIAPRSIRSSPRRTTPATASITPRPARRWCRARPACRSSSARWRLP